MQLECYELTSDTRLYNNGQIPFDSLNSVISKSYGTLEQCQRTMGQHDWIKKVVVTCPETYTEFAKKLMGPNKEIPITQKNIWNNSDLITDVEELELIE